MNTNKDNPRVYIPPPLFYVATFLLSVLLEKYVPLSRAFFQKSIAQNLAVLFIFVGAMFILPAVLRFLKSKNTLATILPATSLQTTGIYAYTRNPMYLGLLCIYTGTAFILGNWWTFMFIPLVILAVTYAVIRKEEAYLERAFGEAYVTYRGKVRRWV
jgi:protein-S-isoprenylcysteine O-methyltransferase Ste14